MGMLATVINCIAFQNALELLGVPTRLQTAIQMEQIAEGFIRRRAMRHLEKGRVVVFGAGTGNPYFTTDTAAVLRAVEIEADVVIKGTRVDGVYDKDPEKHADARRFSEISYKETLERNLRVMDMTAITMASENSKPILVFNMNQRGNLRRLLLGEPVATIVRE
jgi:uridylate kinase